VDVPRRRVERVLRRGSSFPGGPDED
jgi:hypothetical protein